MRFNCCRWRLVKIECISCYCCLVFKSSFGTESFLFCLAVSASLFVHSNSNFEIKIKVNFNLSKRRKSICPGKSGGFSITHREGEVIMHSLTQSFRPTVYESLRRLHLRPSNFSACCFFTVIMLVRFVPFVRVPKLIWYSFHCSVPRTIHMCNMSAALKCCHEVKWPVRLYRAEFEVWIGLRIHI